MDDGVFYKILSLPHNIVMGLNNVTAFGLLVILGFNVGRVRGMLVYDNFLSLKNP